jgi:hypothetical protein
MIKINKIEPPTIDLFDPNGKCLGTLNEYEFLDARVQIKKAQIFGYYVMFKNRRIRLDRNATLEDNPDGLFDMMSNFYLDLMI